MRKEIQIQWHLSRLRSQDWQQREKSALALGELGDAQAVPALCSLLLGEDPEGPFQTLFDKLMIPAGCKDPDSMILATQEADRFPVRVAAARSLGLLRDRRAVPALIAALEDSSSDVSCEAAVALGLIRDDRAIFPLVSLLKSHDADESNAASQTLGLMGTVSIPWVAELLKQSHFEARAAAARTLGLIGDPKGAVVLCGALADADSSVRRAVMDALVLIGRPAVPFLLQSVGVSNPEAVVAAIKALGRIGDTSAMPELLKKAGSEHSEVRETAQLALAALGWKPASARREVLRLVEAGEFDRALEFGCASVEPLVEAFRCGDGPVRKKLEEAMSGLPSEAITCLANFVGDADFEVRHLALRLMTHLGWVPCDAAERARMNVSWGRYEKALEEGDAALPWLITALGWPGEWDRASAARAIGRMKAPDAERWLIESLQDEHYQVREAAAEVLENFTGQEVVAALEHAAKDGHYNVRSAAARSLRLIQGRSHDG